MILAMSDRLLGEPALMPDSNETGETGGKSATGVT